MKPVSGYIFVEEASKAGELKKAFTTVDSQEAKYQVIEIAEDVTRCKVGDFVLFTDVKQYQFDGEKVTIVREDDIVAVKTYSELKK